MLAATASDEGPEVRGLIPGGSRIRTLGPRGVRDHCSLRQPLFSAFRVSGDGTESSNPLRSSSESSEL
jgi:hypothetical protein